MWTQPSFACFASNVKRSVALYVSLFNIRDTSLENYHYVLSSCSAPLEASLYTGRWRWQRQGEEGSLGRSCTFWVVAIMAIKCADEEFRDDNLNIVQCFSPLTLADCLCFCRPWCCWNLQTCSLRWVSSARWPDECYNAWKKLWRKKHAYFQQPLAQNQSKTQNCDHNCLKYLTKNL